MGTVETGSRKPRVAVFGDFMSDIYWIGTAERMSAEVPIPIVKIEKQLARSGGAGNVINNLEALGVEAINCSSYGPVKHRLMVGDYQIARWDLNDSCKPYEGEMPEADAYVIADYNKGGLPQNINWPRPLFIDTKKPPHVFPEDATFFPNEKEYEQFEDEYSKLPRVVLKRGSKGIEYLSVGKQLAYFPAKASHVINVNGAGDTVLAAFVFSALEGRGIYRCTEFANYAAAVVVEKPLTAVATREEIERKMIQ